MALLTPEKLREASIAIVDTFNNTIDAYKAEIEPLLTITPINEDTFVHPFSFGPGPEREWTGERQLKSVVLHEIFGKVVPYDNSLSVPMNDIMSERIGRHINAATKLGRESATFYDRRVAQLLTKNTAVNYDGKVLFATGRTFAGGTQSNLFGSRALTAANLVLAEQDLNGMKDDKGEALYVRGTHLIVSPANAETARQLIDFPFDSSGASNSFFKRYTIVVLPGVADDYWYLVGADEGVLPFMAYEFVPGNLVAFDQMDDYSVAYKDEANYLWTQKSVTVAGPYQFIVANRTVAL